MILIVPNLSKCSKSGDKTHRDVQTSQLVQKDDRGRLLIFGWLIDLNIKKTLRLNRTNVVLVINVDVVLTKI